MIGNFQKALIPLLAPVTDFVPDPENARIHGDENMEAIRTSLSTFSQVTPIVFWRKGAEKIVIKGNGTFRAACELGWTHIAATEFEGSEVFARAYAIADNRTAELAEWDSVRLTFQMEAIQTQWEVGPEVAAWTPTVVGWSTDALEEVKPRKPKESAPAAAPAQPEAIDAKFEVSEDTLSDGTQVLPGDVYELAGPTGLIHRVMCGDSVKPEDVSTLMGGEHATLLHSDPPYGLGKEADGVANDNLHGDKLDAFQVSWWNACVRHVKKTGSIYVWGVAADLWRLWYRYLDPEVEGIEGKPAAVVRGPLSVRNEIVWDKGTQLGAAGQRAADEMRSFPPNTERALFLMMGEQELSIDADQYWEGWEPLRTALKDEADKAEWSDKDVAKIAGVTTRMASHWFGKSQWVMIPEERYQKLQEAGREFDAFQYPYEAIRGVYDQLAATFDAEVKQAFYASRAYFDLQDGATEVWTFPRVIGEERFGHPTPKPVPMIVRAIKSSCPEGEIVLEPFAGSGATLIAAEDSGRRCFTMEIQPKFVATTIKRWEAKTGASAVLVSRAEAAA